VETRGKRLARIIGDGRMASGGGPGPVPPELEAQVRSMLDKTVLRAALDLAAFSPDLEHFRAELQAIPQPPEPWDPADEPEPDVEKPSDNGRDA
jgi:hypothetical protein